MAQGEEGEDFPREVMAAVDNAPAQVGRLINGVLKLIDDATGEEVPIEILPDEEGQEPGPKQVRYPQAGPTSNPNRGSILKRFASRGRK